MDVWYMCFVSWSCRCEDEEVWCAPLPESTYQMEGLENAATLPLRGERCGRATTYNQPFTATLNPSPNEELMPVNPRLQHPDLLLRYTLLRLIHLHVSVKTSTRPSWPAPTLPDG